MYHTCATVLREELGVDPEPAIEELYMRLLRLEDEPDPRKSKTQSVVIPLFGRQEEWRLLSERWQQVQKATHIPQQTDPTLFDTLSG